MGGGPAAAAGTRRGSDLRAPQGCGHVDPPTSPSAAGAAGPAAPPALCALASGLIAPVTLQIPK